MYNEKVFGGLKQGITSVYRILFLLLYGNGSEGVKNRSFHSSPGRRDWAKVIALEMQKIDWLGIR